MLLPLSYLLSGSWSFAMTSVELLHVFSPPLHVTSPLCPSDHSFNHLLLALHCYLSLPPPPFHVPPACCSVSDLYSSLHHPLVPTSGLVSIVSSVSTFIGLAMARLHLPRSLSIVILSIFFSFFHHSDNRTD